MPLETVLPSTDSYLFGGHAAAPTSAMLLNPSSRAFDFHSSVGYEAPPPTALEAFDSFVVQMSGNDIRSITGTMPERLLTSPSEVDDVLHNAVAAYSDLFLFH